MSYLVEKRRKSAARVAGLCILLLLVAADLLFVARLRTKVGPTSYLLTDLARAHETLFPAAMGCWAVAAVLISVCVERALQPTAWVPLGVLLMRLQAVALTLMAFAMPGPPGDVASLSTTLHQIGFYSALFFGSVCPLVLGSAFRWDPEWTALTWPGRFVTMAGLGTVVALMLFPPGQGAIWEVSAILSLILWLVLCAIGVMRSVRWFRVPWEKVRKRTN